MFDASVVCLIRLASSPVASCEALRELKELMDSRRAVGSGEVIQAQHQSLSHTGGSDAKPGQVTACKPTAVVSSNALNAPLAKSATGGSAPDRNTARTMVSSASSRRRTGNKPGGAR
jgi:hypothetical protein